LAPTFWYAPEVPGREGVATELNRTWGGEGPSVRYSETFKGKMVEKMTGSNGRSATSLSEDVGVSQASLSRWLKRAATVPAVTKKKTTKSKRRRSVTSRTTKRPQDWTPERKLEVVLEAAALGDDALGEFLRRKGLHEAQLEQWRKQLTEAAAEVFGSRQRKKTSPEVKRIRELEKELLRKDKALAEAAALIVLKKKVLAIWGDEDDDTGPRSGR